MSNNPGVIEMTTRGLTHAVDTRGRREWGGGGGGGGALRALIRADGGRSWSLDHACCTRPLRSCRRSNPEDYRRREQPEITSYRGRSETRRVEKREGIEPSSCSLPLSSMETFTVSRVSVRVASPAGAKSLPPPRHSAKETRGMRGCVALSRR